MTKVSHKTNTPQSTYDPIYKEQFDKINEKKLINYNFNFKEIRTLSDLNWKIGLTMFNEIIESQNKSKKKKILEIGCGLSSFIRYFAIKGHSVTGVDINEKMISSSEKLFKFNNISEDYNLIVGDAEKLEFEDQSFDVVYSGGVIEFFLDPKNVLNEKIRILKKDGLFFANIVPGKFCSQLIVDSLINFLKKLLNIFLKKKFKIINYLSKDIKLNNYNLKKYLKFLENNGLTEVKGIYINHIPNIPFPKKIKERYVKYFLNKEEALKKEYLKNGIMKKLFSSTYLIYGKKK